MKTFALKKIAQSLALVSVAAFGSSVYAASTWNFSTCNSTAGTQTGSGTFGNSWSCGTGTTDTNKVTVTAWGGKSGATGFQTAYVSPQSGSGFGIASQLEGIGATSPNHAADNSPANSTPDMFLLKFDSAVALDKVTLGWNQTDADFTLMAYTGSSLSITGKTASNLTSGGTTSGWALVQQVSNSATPINSDDIVNTVNQSSVVSSWWLISAAGAGFNGATLDSTADYFKLFSVASKDTKVPEPGSLALMGAAMVGFMATRRRKAKAV